MLTLKFYENAKLGTTEITAAGHTAHQVVEDLLKAVPSITGKATVTRYKRFFRTIGLPTWGIYHCKVNQTSAWMLDTLIKNNAGEWIEFNEYEFLPQNAKQIICAQMGKTPKSAECLAGIVAKTRERSRAMTPEDRAELSRRQRAGWEKRRAAIAAGEIVPKKRKPLTREAIEAQAAGRAVIYEKRRTDPKARAEFEARHNSPEAIAERQRRKIERQIAQGRRRPPDAVVPDWFELPDDEE